VGIFRLGGRSALRDGRPPYPDVWPV